MKKSKVPLSVPGVKRRMSSAGHSGFTSDHFCAVVKMSPNSSRVTLVRKVFSLLTTMAMASVPTRNSTGTRAGERAAQASTSESLMPRLALAMSVSPVLQKRSKPPPLPIEERVCCPV